MKNNSLFEIFSSFCNSFWISCLCRSSHQAALSLGWLEDELQKCSATPVDLTKTSCVYVHVSLPPSWLLTYRYPPPTLRSMQKPPKPSWGKKNNIYIYNYKFFLCINLVGCFPQVPFVSNTCCSCRGMQRRGEDGTHALCEGGCHQHFGVLWVPHSWKDCPVVLLLLLLLETVMQKVIHISLTSYESPRSAFHIFILEASQSSYMWYYTWAGIDNK